MMANDKTQEEFSAYVDKVGLPAVPWNFAQARKGLLKEAWGISTIPHVVLLDRSTGTVVHNNIRLAIEIVHRELDSEEFMAKAREQFANKFLSRSHKAEDSAL